MQQRQLRLGDILDDYCPRERRLTNHAVVAMVGDDVKQTRCTTCDAEHEFKHARLPRQRRKNEPVALGAPVMAAPKKVVHEPVPMAVADAAPAAVDAAPVIDDDAFMIEDPLPAPEPVAPVAAPAHSEEESDDDRQAPEEGPVHRQLIRAQLPRLDNQPPSARPAPDFTIRQPTGRQNRFRPRHQRGTGGGGGGQMFGNRGNGANGNVARDPRGGQRGPGGRPPMNAHPNNRQGHGRKRSK